VEVLGGIRDCAWFETLSLSFSLRLLCVLCVSVVNRRWQNTHHRGRRDSQRKLN
jgi:hypothetical protein